MKIDLKPYLKAMDDSHVVWMDGTELGHAVGFDIPTGKHPILLWPYKHPTIASLALTMTEEVAHYHHKEALAADYPGTPEKEVMNKLSRSLMRDPRWQAAVYKKLAGLYHVELKNLSKDKGVTLG